jgi:antitoxin component YwqK of YwqJK toxin-antitoxin module
MIRVNEADLDWDDDNLPWYDGEPFTGECVETAPDGRLLSLTTYENRLGEGPFRGWSNDGVLILEGTSHRNLPVGTQREWYGTGAPKYEREYGEQGRLLAYRHWDEDGNLVEDKSFPPPGV